MTAKDVFLVFYGVYLATSLLSLGRYRLFDTHVLAAGGKEGRRALRRFGAGLFFMNLLPLAWFISLHEIVPAREDLWGVGWAALAALSAFGFHRILHGVVAAYDSRWDLFYNRRQWHLVLCKWQQDWPGDWPNTATVHMAPGFLYLTLGALFALAARC